MTETTEIRILIPPVPASRFKARLGGGGGYGKLYSKFRTLAPHKLRAEAMLAGIDLPIEGALVLSLDVRIPKPRTSQLPFPKPDIDNFAKAALDVANGILWVDDWQIWTLNQTKLWLPTGSEGHIIYKFSEELPP
jgi:Holliday junction resolvase RusA-like endonuclease